MSAKEGVVMYSWKIQEEPAERKKTICLNITFKLIEGKRKTILLAQEKSSFLSKTAGSEKFLRFPRRGCWEMSNM